MNPTNSATSAIRSWPTGAPRSLLLAIASIVMSAAPAMATELTGVVIDRHGEPADNVTVGLSTFDRQSFEPIVLSETITGDGGGFRITVPDHWFDLPRISRTTLSLIAKTENRGTGAIVVDPELPRHRLAIRLEPWTRRRISLRSADDKPLAGVRVSLTGLLAPAIYPPRFSRRAARQWAAIPDGPLRSTGTTDDSGIAEMLLPPLESVATIEAEIEKNVVVNWSVYSSNVSVPKNWSETLRVPESRRLPVEVTFGAGAASDLRLSVISTPQQGNTATTTIRHAIDLNPDGMATVQVRTEATLSLRNTSDHPTDMRLSQGWGWFDNSTTLKKLSVSFGKGVRVTGRAVSTGGEPAGAIRLIVRSGGMVSDASTDDNGRFEFDAPAGRVLLIPSGRSGYRLIKFSLGSLLFVPKGKETHDLGDVAFIRLKSLKGHVRDETGKAVGGAIVTALWDEPDVKSPEIRHRRVERIETGDDGAFTIPGLDPSAEPMLAARRDGAVTERLQLFDLDTPDDPVSLTVARAAATVVSGRVIDQSGNGLGGLEVTLRHRLRLPPNDAHLPFGADVDGIRLITDESGAYATPKTLPPWGEYVALIRTGTKREAVSGWKSALSGTAIVLPTIEDAATAKITGRILTTDGMPVSKARIVVLTSDGQQESQSNDDGTFAIDRPAGRMPLLIAEADGFLANGVPIESEQAALEIVLPRTDQLPLKSQVAGEADAPQPARWTVERKRELAVKLADGFGAADPRTKASADRAIARYLPDRILERLDSLPPNDQMIGQLIRMSLANGLAEDRLEEGLRLLNAFPDGPMKIHGLAGFERAAKMNDADRMQLLARIVQDARGVRQAEHRVAVLGVIGGRLLDLRQRDSGEALLRDSLKDAKKLAPVARGGYARGAYAQELARVDADGALELIEPLTETSEFNRYLESIAHELALIDPGRAVAILDMMRVPDKNHRPIADEREQAALRVCYRMIRVAPEKAVNLGRSIEHMALGSYCFGLMAESLLGQEDVNDADGGLARRLHDEAWRMLAGVRRERDLSQLRYLYPSTVAAYLLRHTAELAPQQLPHRIWQTIALRRPIEKSGDYHLAGLDCTCEMALMMADVDRNEARNLARWLPTPASGSSRFALYVQSVRSAAALIVELNPDQCEAALEVVTDARANQILRLRSVQALLRTGNARARANRGAMALWFPDDEDIGPVD